MMLALATISTGSVPHLRAAFALGGGASMCKTR